MTFLQVMAELQSRLNMNDAMFSAYIHTDVTTIRKARAGVADMPLHSKLLVLDRTGFMKITSTLMMCLPQTTQAKINDAIQHQALNIAQQNALKQLMQQYEGQQLE